MKTGTGKIAYFNLKKGQGFPNRVAHSHLKFQGGAAPRVISPPTVDATVCLVWIGSHPASVHKLSKTKKERDRHFPNTNRTKSHLG